ncbi:MAG TPA: ABC transporter permease [Ignavibacteriaceae bacterium]|nr:ABC transporter permease [Ignavibacteriaceae bacterium]
MNKTLAIAKWEYLEKVKTKAFIISLIITPAIIILFSVVPTLLVSKEDNTTRMIGFLDKSGMYFNDLNTEISKHTLDNGQPLYVLVNLDQKELSEDEIKTKTDEATFKGKYDSFIYIKYGGTDSITIELRSKGIANFRDIGRFSDAFETVRISHRIQQDAIDPDIVEFFMRGVKINQIKIEEGGKEGKANFETVFFSSFIFILLLMMMVIYSGQMLVRSLLEEKSNRIIEILVSSCNPNELLAGKVFGLSALGLTQILIWMMIGIALAGSAVIPMEAFKNILPMLVYFILGFIFFTTLFVGIGSIVSTEQEAQQITSYLSIIMVIPVVIVFPAMQNPDSSLIKVLSYIPITTPSVMLLRLNIAPVPLWEIAATLGLLIVSTLITIKFSAKIFRIGILAYGKMPNIRELKSWLREK